MRRGYLFQRKAPVNHCPQLARFHEFREVFEVLRPVLGKREGDVLVGESRGPGCTGVLLFAGRFESLRGYLHQHSSKQE